jgi:hypothetical protein
MMKKLVATVFVLSLTALGCGSDSGTQPKPDAAPDTRPGAEVQPDQALPGPEAGPEAQPDLAKGPDLAQPIDTTKPIDVTTPSDVAKPVDVGTIDGGKDDAPITTPIDGGAADVQPSEAGAPIDGGAIDGGARG